MARILIVEDSADLAFGLQRTLENEGHTVIVASDGTDGVHRAQAFMPQLVILDLMLPGIDGYQVLQRLRDSGVDAPVLVLTARSEEADKVYGFRLGADDYVTKPFSLSELVARVGALLRRSGGTTDPAREIIRFGDVEVNVGARTVTKGGTPVALSPLEYALLLALIRKAGVAVSRLSLLQEVWGHRAEVMTRTVDIHIAEIRRKIEDVPAEPRHIITVRKHGYRFERGA